MTRLLDDPDHRERLERDAVARAAQWPDAAAVATTLRSLYEGLA